MNRDELRDLAAGYALGALTEAERRRFEALLDAGDSEARAALREYGEVVTAVAGDLREAPPAAVKAALMARVSAERAGGRALPAGGPAGPRRRPAWRWVGTAALAAGLAALAVGATLSQRYEARLDRLARETAALREQLQAQQALLALLRDPATQVVALAGQPPSPEARGRAIWHAAQGGMLVAAGLPAAPAGTTYQAWAIAGQAPPVGVGVFAVDARGTGSLQLAPIPGLARVDVFAVTLEPAGGRPAPTGAMYLAGKAP
jgi:anti-sigma-K factor RskA